MSKTVEVVKQVRLSPQQKVLLMKASDNKGLLVTAPSWEQQALLCHLGLIEERARYTAAEKKEIDAKIRQAHKALIVAARKLDLGAVDKHRWDIQRAQTDKDRKAWFITKVAEEYLLKGKVLITK